MKSRGAAEELAEHAGERTWDEINDEIIDLELRQADLREAEQAAVIACKKITTRLDALYDSLDDAPDERS